jgi:hypothetical protein
LKPREIDLRDRTGKIRDAGRSLDAIGALEWAVYFTWPTAAGFNSRSKTSALWSKLFQLNPRTAALPSRIWLQLIIPCPQKHHA